MTKYRNTVSARMCIAAAWSCLALAGCADSNELLQQDDTDELEARNDTPLASEDAELLELSHLELGGSDVYFLRVDGQDEILLREDTPVDGGVGPLAQLLATEQLTSLEAHLALAPEAPVPEAIAEAQAAEAQRLGRATADVREISFAPSPALWEKITRAECERDVLTPLRGYGEWQRVANIERRTPAGQAIGAYGVDFFTAPREVGLLAVCNNGSSSLRVTLKAMAQSTRRQTSTPASVGLNTRSAFYRRFTTPHSHSIDVSPLSSPIAYFLITGVAFQN